MTKALIYNNSERMRDYFIVKVENSEYLSYTLLVYLMFISRHNADYYSFISNLPDFGN